MVVVAVCIGGGDWAKDRIVSDCMKNWSNNKIVELRSPKATRPWQHVLEPISGYLNLASKLYKDKSLHGEAFNFGPKLKQNQTVEELIKDLSKHWNLEDKNIYKIKNSLSFHEAKLLKLNSNKAFSALKWKPNLDYKDNIRLTSEWYFDFYKTKKDMFDKTQEQILEYENLAKKNKLKWME